MADELWLFAVAGGAGLLGVALAFGLIIENRKRAMSAMAGAFIVAIVCAGLAIVLSTQAPTAETRSSDRAGTQYDLPARPSDENALPASR